MVENHELVVPYVNTDENLADFFTKPLTAKKFFPMRNKIMNVCDETSIVLVDRMPRDNAVPNE